MAATKESMLLLSPKVSTSPLKKPVLNYTRFPHRREPVRIKEKPAGLWGYPTGLGNFLRSPVVCVGKIILPSWF